MRRHPTFLLAWAVQHRSAVNIGWTQQARSEKQGDRSFVACDDLSLNQLSKIRTKYYYVPAASTDSTAIASPFAVPFTFTDLPAYSLNLSWLPN